MGKVFSWQYTITITHLNRSALSVITKMDFFQHTYTTMIKRRKFAPPIYLLTWKWDFYHQCSEVGQNHSNWDNPTQIGKVGQSVDMTCMCVSISDVYLKWREYVVLTIILHLSSQAWKGKGHTWRLCWTLFSSTSLCSSWFLASPSSSSFCWTCMFFCCIWVSLCCSSVVTCWSWYSQHTIISIIQ